MRYYVKQFSVFIFLLLPTQVLGNEITLQELFFDESKPYHLKILEALPESAIIEFGPKDAKNTIIEFMDYFCGYCKKIHPELIDLAKSNDDLRVVFIHHPILNESSNVLAEIAIAASMQNKGYEFHHALFSVKAISSG